MSNSCVNVFVYGTYSVSIAIKLVYSIIFLNLKKVRFKSEFQTFFSFCACTNSSNSVNNVYINNTIQNKDIAIRSNNQKVNHETSEILLQLANTI